MELSILAATLASFSVACMLSYYFLVRKETCQLKAEIEKPKRRLHQDDANASL